MLFSFPIKFQNKTSQKFLKQTIFTAWINCLLSKDIIIGNIELKQVKQVKIFQTFNFSRMEGQNLQLFYPYQIISEFEKKATQNIENGVQKKLMACVIGHKDGNKLIGEELLFPKQSSPYSHVTESKEHLLGK